MEKNMVKAYITGKMGIDMKEILKMIKQKEKSYIIGIMEIGLWDIILMIKKLEYMLFFMLMVKLLKNTMKINDLILPNL